MTTSTARRTHPKLWEKSKKRGCTVARMCRHSARKMQWAVRDYTRRGGGYTGPKRASSNSLARWTKQRWRTHSGKPSAGLRRYLPDAAWSRLSPDQIRRTNASKRRGFRTGRQWVKQPEDVVRALRKSTGSTTTNRDARTKQKTAHS